MRRRYRDHDVAVKRNPQPPSRGEVRALLLWSVLILVWTTAACAEPLDFADWAIMVPPETVVIEYPGVPAQERGERIELTRELVISGPDASGEPVLLSPADVAVDGEGRIYVLDAAAREVRVFDADGNRAGTIGRRGAGPGELLRPASLTIFADGRIGAMDGQRGRLITWNGDGEPDREYLVSGARDMVAIHATEQGVVADVPHSSNLYGGDWTWRGQALALGSGESTLIAELPYTTLPAVERRSDEGIPAFWFTEFPTAVPTLAADAGGSVYVTPAAEYQLFAFGPDGAMSWALRAALPPPPLTEARVEGELERLRQHFPDLVLSEIPRPERLAAVLDVAIDGHGHIYVFPNANDVASGDSLADVYTRSGERIFTGIMSGLGWRAAHGDHVYRIEIDATSGERGVARYRLEEPFE
jgi:hypothetical protein